MKRNTILLVLTLFLSLSSFASSLDANKNKKTPKERIQQIEARIYEVWHSDLKSLDESERELVKQELKSFKKEIKQINGLDDKVSISVGALIIILLLLIIIL